MKIETSFTKCFVLGLMLAFVLFFTAADFLEAKGGKSGGSFGGSRSSGSSYKSSSSSSSSRGSSFGNRSTSTSSGSRSTSSPSRSSSVGGSRSTAGTSIRSNPSSLSSKGSFGGNRISSAKSYTSKYGAPRKRSTYQPTYGGGYGRSYVVYHNGMGGFGYGLMAGYMMGSAPWYWHTPFHPAFYHSKPYYAHRDPEGTKYKWFVQNGVIQGTNTDDEVEIKWGNPGPGKVSLIKITNNNSSQTFTMDVSVFKADTTLKQEDDKEDDVKDADNDNLPEITGQKNVKAGDKAVYAIPVTVYPPTINWTTIIITFVVIVAVIVLIVYLVKKRKAKKNSQSSFV